MEICLKIFHLFFSSFKIYSEYLGEQFITYRIISSNMNEQQFVKKGEEGNLFV